MSDEYIELPENEKQKLSDMTLLEMRIRRRPVYTLMEMEDILPYPIGNIHETIRELKDSGLMWQRQWIGSMGTYLFGLTEGGKKRAEEVKESEKKARYPLVRKILARGLLRQYPKLDVTEDRLAELLAGRPTEHADA